ncbi:dimethylhistidine N-methyltransferase [Gillisia mitskevichiae]|uniref:Dimethylhistidine N-methyltransferase n=1 Tax=Gillisia mitskevichiae TaxID=270921 RepID=A0A495Q051_9FLAO|nr:L-histidine N(alpha)-methyltransferase [Gillisia mitskevichiae]RKS56084.1 dimethylhistidine N-methyltransferase [Gillisia mitskevichiae]
MENNTKIKFASAFEEDVYTGLTSYPKHLSSKYFYDKKGDKLFQDIMNLPEYYLTNCEYNILANNTKQISDAFAGDDGFDLIELGAGDGKKTKLVLRYLIDNKIDFDYLPVDISQNALDDLEGSLKEELPSLSVKPQQGTYFKTLERLSDYNSRKKVILVLGSNIGNLLHEDAIDFLRQIQEAMSPDDMLFMGFDQKKNPQTILDAYNDPTGVTEAFNKNVLERINTEMDADFDLDSFFHWETYNPETGTAKSFLISNKKQEVNIKNLDLTIHFETWESIHTEISQKYDDMIVEWLASQADLKVTDSFTDEKNFYKNYIFRKK